MERNDLEVVPKPGPILKRSVLIAGALKLETLNTRYIYLTYKGYSADVLPYYLGR
jgi:hypothetical protein